MYLSSVAARCNSYTARFLFSSSGNSLSGKHFTHMNLLCISFYAPIILRHKEGCNIFLHIFQFFDFNIEFDKVKCYTVSIYMKPLLMALILRIWYWTGESFTGAGGVSFFQVMPRIEKGIVYH